MKIFILLPHTPVAKMDYSKLSLTQAKRFEMESQVKALELEKELEMERTRLAELRKYHYHLAGSSEGWDEVRERGGEGREEEGGGGRDRGGEGRRGL